MKKKLFAKIMACACLISSLYIPEITVHAATTETSTLNEADLTLNQVNSNDCLVDVNVGSYFTVTLPKKIMLAGSDGIGNYDVTVKGDIGGRRRVSVVPDEKFNLKSDGKVDVETLISQPKKVFDWSEVSVVDDNQQLVGTTTTGNVTAGPLTKGTWSGTFNFNVDAYTYSQIGVEATDQNDVDLNAEAFTIEGQEKKELIDALVNSDLVPDITNPDDVDALIEVKSDEFDNIADTTFTVTGVLNEGDTVVILHYNEETGEWEYIGTDTVEDGKIEGDFTSYSPVAFIVVKEDGSLHSHSYTLTYEQEGSCTVDGVKTYTCECGDSKTETVTATGHVDDDDNEICDVCGEIIEYTPFTLTSENYYQAGIERSGDVVIPETFKYDGDFYEVTGIGASAFLDCTDLTSIDIPDSVASIGYGAFHDCSGLTNITIPNSVTSLSSGVFEGCTELTNIILSDNITCLDDGVFASCSGLTSITIPEGVTRIGISAFTNCSGLTSITIPEGVTRIGISAFTNCTGLTSIVIPDSVTSLGSNVFSGCNNLKDVVLGSGISSIDGGTFGGCNGLESVIINDSVNGNRSIADGTFNGRTNLKTIKIGNGVTSIGYNAFGGCTYLNSVTLPDSLITINGGAFASCTSLTSITIPDNTTSIGMGAFASCTGLTNLDVPSSVKSIGDNAFAGVKHVTYNGTATGSPWGATSIN